MASKLMNKYVAQIIAWDERGEISAVVRRLHGYYREGIPNKQWILPLDRRPVTYSDTCERHSALRRKVESIVRHMKMADRLAIILDAPRNFRDFHLHYQTDEVGGHQRPGHAAINDLVVAALLAQVCNVAALTPTPAISETG